MTAEVPMEIHLMNVSGFEQNLNVGCFSVLLPPLSLVVVVEVGSVVGVEPGNGPVGPPPGPLGVTA